VAVHGEGDGKGGGWGEGGGLEGRVREISCRAYLVVAATSDREISKKRKGRVDPVRTKVLFNRPQVKVGGPTDHSRQMRVRKRKSKKIRGSARSRFCKQMPLSLAGPKLGHERIGNLQGGVKKKKKGLGGGTLVGGR